MKRCEAILITDGIESQCGNNAVGTTSYCRTHTNQLQRSTNSPLFQHGLYTPFKKRFSLVNSQLLDRINELRDDPELWSLKDDVAFVTALMDLRAESINEGISLDHYRALSQTVSALRSSFKSGDYDRVQDCIDTLTEQVRKGQDAFTGSDEVVKLIEKRTDIIETEQRMMHAKAYTLEVDQAYSLIMQVFGVIKAHVKDADELKAIRGGIAKILKTYQDAESDIIDAEVVDETDS